MRRIAGLREIAGRYQGYIIDLWGVMHDGVRPYPGAVEALEALRAGGAGVVFLSNAPRRAAVAEQGLTRMRIPRSVYDAVITSGEATHAALATRSDPWLARLGQRLFHLGPPRDRSVFEGLGLTEVQHPADASFMLNTGPDDERGPTDPAAFDDLLEAALAAGLPMLCANPDLTVIRDGALILCAGTLAERYAALGGEVRNIGKPDPLIYATVLEQLHTPQDRILAIGDSLRTDIAGARAAGIDALWVEGGIHANDPAAALQAKALGAVACLHRLIW